MSMKGGLSGHFQEFLVRYENNPRWKELVGLPTASGRPLTVLEKVVAVLQSIKAAKMLSIDRGDLSKPFTMENLSARRLHIDRSGNVINLWISLRPNCSAFDDRLFLIEDFAAEERSPIHSGYSSLDLLVAETTPSNGDSEARESPLSELVRRDGSTYKQLAADPVGTLVSIGGVSGPDHAVQAIYRFRGSLVEPGLRPRTVVTIGYPLVIYTALP
jgi:hypothetical protein